MSVRESEPDNESNQDVGEQKFLAIENKSLNTIKEEEFEESVRKDNNFMEEDSCLTISDLLSQDLEFMSFMNKKKSIISNVQKIASMTYKNDPEK